MQTEEEPASKSQSIIDESVREDAEVDTNSELSLFTEMPLISGELYDVTGGVLPIWYIYNCNANIVDAIINKIRTSQMFSRA